MSELLNLPPVVKMDAGDASPAVEALCLTLYRLAFPCRLSSMKVTFTHDKSAISRIVKKTVMLLSQEWSQILQWDHTRLTRAKLEEYAQAVADQG
ncbi:hypothetical protein BG000_006479, partial [Podila horticola]